MTRIAPFLLALVGLALAFAILEGGLRFVAERRAATFVGSPVEADDVQPDPTLVAWFKPNYTEPDGHASFDALGFRENGSPRTEPATQAIAFLGGSTAYGWGADDAHTIEAFLEQDLGKTVVNAGYPGLTTLDTVLVYREKVGPLHPRLTVVLAGLNDLYYAVDWSPRQRLHWANTSYEVSLRARHDPALRPLADGINRIVMHNCFTCYYLGSALSSAYDHWSAPPLLGLANLLGQQPMASPNDRAMELTAFALDELARQVRQDGGCLIVAWQPIGGVTSSNLTPAAQGAVQRVELNAPGWGRIAPIMYADLRRRTQPLFDSGAALQADLGEALDSLSGEVYQDDGVHYSAAANEVIASQLAPIVAQAACR